MLSSRNIFRTGVAAVCAFLAIPILRISAVRAKIVETQLTLSATSPRIADGVDQSVIDTTVRDSNGVPVTNADVALDIRPPDFMNQLNHYVVHLLALNINNGKYTSAFVSPFDTPFFITGIDRVSGALGMTTADFVAPVTIATVSRSVLPRLDAPEIEETALTRIPVRFDAESDNARDYFRKLDDEFYPPTLRKKIAAETDPAKKAALEQRLEDLGKALAAIDADIKLERAKAAGEDTTAAQADFNAKKAAASDSVKRLGEKQEEILKQFFGNPIDFEKFQKATELFNNFELVPKLDEALDRIKKVKQLQADIQAETDPAKKAALQQQLKQIIEDGIVIAGPDASIAHIRWAKFANIAIELGHQTDLWRNLKPVLAKGSAITIAVLDKTKQQKQTAEQIKTIRDMYDPLKPKPDDSDAEKKRKLEELEKKLIELVKTILIDKKVIAQLPGFDSNRTILVTLTGSNCTDGNAGALAQRFSSPFTLHQSGLDLFGLGVDNRGFTYVAVGSVLGSQASFVIGGFGLTPGLGQGIARFDGSVLNDEISGNGEGILQLVVNGASDPCSWTANFDIQPRLVCDLNGDRQVDRNDLAPIFAARNTLTASGDFRDADGDGTVTVNDVRFCTLRCRNANCAP